jgi:hypothetical protein
MRVAVTGPRHRRGSFREAPMRAAYVLLFGWLAVSQVGCVPVDVKQAV